MKAVLVTQKIENSTDKNVLMNCYKNAQPSSPNICISEKKCYGHFAIAKSGNLKKIN